MRPRLQLGLVASGGWGGSSAVRGPNPQPTEAAVADDDDHELGRLSGQHWSHQQLSTKDEPTDAIPTQNDLQSGLNVYDAERSLNIEELGDSNGYKSDQHSKLAEPHARHRRKQQLKTLDTAAKKHREAKHSAVGRVQRDGLVRQPNIVAQVAALSKC